MNLRPSTAAHTTLVPPPLPASPTTCPSPCAVCAPSSLCKTWHICVPALLQKAHWDSYLKWGIEYDCPIFHGLFRFCRQYAAASIGGWPGLSTTPAHGWGPAVRGRVAQILHEGPVSPVWHRVIGRYTSWCKKLSSALPVHHWSSLAGLVCSSGPVPAMLGFAMLGAAQAPP